MTTKAQNIVDFTEYLTARWDYIEKIDMIRDTREVQKMHNISLGQAVKIWNSIYGDDNTASADFYKGEGWTLASV